MYRSNRWPALLCALLCALAMCAAFFPPCALGEGAAENDLQTLSEEELTRLLWELYQTENEGAEFLVLPEDYQMPAAGKRGIFNLLLIGVDTDRGDLRGRSDTMLLASLNALTGELKLVSFMRDTYVAIPGKGRNRLNAAYAYGGAELLGQTLGRSFGVAVDGYVAVNYALMVELVDAIGGVELTVTEDELGKLNGILEYYNLQRGAPEKQGRLESAGTQTLTGLQAMSYARIRKLDSDFVRVERQQTVVMAIYRRLTTLDFSALTDVCLTYIGRVGTDVTLARAVSLLATVLEMRRVDITTLRVPVNGAYSSRMLNGAYYIVPNLEKNQAALREFLGM